jgi:hypothetical protein
MTKQLSFADYNVVAFDPETHKELVRRAVYAKHTSCLRCRTAFVSEDVRFNRVCSACRGLPSWSDGVTEHSATVAF